MVDQAALSELDRDNVPSPTLFANPDLRFKRVHLPCSHRVPEKDPRIRLSHNRRRSRRTQCHRRVLPRRPTSKVRAADDYRVLGLGLVVLHESRRIGGWEATERVRTELLVLWRIGRHEGEVLGRDDLVSVDVIADDVAESVECCGSAGGGGGRRSCCGGLWDSSSGGALRLLQVVAW